MRGEAERGGAAPFASDFEDAFAFVGHVVMAAVTGFLATLWSIRFLPGWVGATAGVGQGLAWCAVLLVRHPSRWLVNVVAFGLVAGVVELLADAWLVHGTGTLRYPAEGPFLLASPAYMPAAWFGMLSAGMALGVVLRRRLSLPATTALVALALGSYIPAYEALARQAGWWSYEGTTLLLGAVPPYVVGGEVLLALPLVAVTERLARSGWPTACLLGALQGSWIFASYALAWALVG